MRLTLRLSCCSQSISSLVRAALCGGDRMGWITVQARLQAVLKAPVVIHIDFNALTSGCTTSQERLKASGHAFVLMHM
jgi:hypothetical protein